MEIIHSLIILAKEKKKKASEQGRWMNNKWLDYFSLFLHVRKKKDRIFFYKIILGEIIERGSKEGLLGHLEALEEEEN